jgi:hypothetical protein
MNRDLSDGLEDHMKDRGTVSGTFVLTPAWQATDRKPAALPGATRCRRVGCSSNGTTTSYIIKPLLEGHERFEYCVGGHRGRFTETQPRPYPSTGRRASATVALRLLETLRAPGGTTSSSRCQCRRSIWIIGGLQTNPTAAPGRRHSGWRPPGSYHRSRWLGEADPLRGGGGQEAGPVES